jgi:hypothetical protein
MRVDECRGLAFDCLRLGEVIEAVFNFGAVTKANAHAEEELRKTSRKTSGRNK